MIEDKPLDIVSLKGSEGGVVVEICHREEYPLIKCPHCRMAFVLVAILEGEGGSVCWMKQEWVDFCPYCGKEVREW